MYSAASTASLKSIAIPEEWQKRIDTTPEWTQSGKFPNWRVRIQQRVFVSVRSCSATRLTKITSWQVTGCDTKKLVLLRDGQCTPTLDPPKLRCSAIKSFLIHIKEAINARKPGTSETGILHDPESADKHVVEPSCESEYAFERALECAISESPKKAGMLQRGNIYGDLNALPLCWVIINETIKDLGGLIEEIRNVRKQGSHEERIQCNPEQIEWIAGKIRECLEELKANEETWMMPCNTDKLCQAVVKGITALTSDCGNDHDSFVRAVMGPIYVIVLNGTLENMSWRQQETGRWGWECFRALVDSAQLFGSLWSENSLSLCNLMILRDLYCQLASVEDKCLFFPRDSPLSFAVADVEDILGRLVDLMQLSVCDDRRLVGNRLNKDDDKIDTLFRKLTFKLPLLASLASLASAGELFGTWMIDPGERARGVGRFELEWGGMA